MLAPIKILERGDVIKIWKRSLGGQGKDYVVVGRQLIGPDNPIIIIIPKNHIKANGELCAYAKFFAIQAKKVKARVAHIDISPFIDKWEDGKIVKTVAPRVEIK